MSKPKSAWQVDSHSFAEIFTATAAVFDPLTAFILAIVAMAVLKVLS